MLIWLFCDDDLSSEKPFWDFELSKGLLVKLLLKEKVFCVIEALNGFACIVDVLLRFEMILSWFIISILLSLNLRIFEGSSSK